jgi:hypothetical protein
MLTNSQIQEYRFLDILHQCSYVPRQIERPGPKAFYTAILCTCCTCFGDIYEVVRNGYGAAGANLFPLAQGRRPVRIRWEPGSWLD